MSKKMRFFTGIVVVFLTMSLTVFAETYSEGYFRYQIVNDQIYIKEYFGSEEAVIIPERIAGLDVTGIGAYAFKSSSVRRITIPESVNEISASAFVNATNLNTIILRSDVAVLPEMNNVKVIEQFPKQVVIATTAEKSTVSATTVEASKGESSTSATSPSSHTTSQETTKANDHPASSASNSAEPDDDPFKNTLEEDPVNSVSESASGENSTAELQSGESRGEQNIGSSAVVTIENGNGLEIAEIEENETGTTAEVSGEMGDSAETDNNGILTGSEKTEETTEVRAASWWGILAAGVIVLSAAVGFVIFKSVKKHEKN